MGLKQRTDFNDERTYQSYLKQQIAEVAKEQGLEQWQRSPSPETLELEQKLNRISPVVTEFNTLEPL